MQLSQAQFAALVGVNLQTVNHWENGKTNISANQKNKIAAVRGLKKRELKKLMTEKNIPAARKDRKIRQPRKAAVVAKAE